MVETKENILGVATQRMQKVGIRSVSVDDICHELGISKKTFYVYFHSKDDLVDAMLLANEKRLVHDIQHMVRHKSVVECIIDWTKIAKKTEKNTHHTPPMLYDLQKYYPSLYDAHRNRMRRAMRAFLVEFLQKGQTEKIFRAEVDVEVSAMLFVNVHVMVVEYADNNQLSPNEMRYVSKASMDVLLRGILTPEGLRILEEAVKQVDKIEK